MSNSPPPPPASSSSPPPFLQAFQGIQARCITNNHASIPVHYHQPTGTRYIPMSVLRHIYPGIVRLHVDGQEIQPRRGLPTVQGIFEGAVSQWVSKTADEEGVDGSSSSEDGQQGNGQSSYVLVGQQCDESQGSQVPTTNFFPHDTVSPALLSQPVSQALFDDGASDNNIEWIEYRPDSIVQVVYYTPGPLPDMSASGSQQPGAGAPRTDTDFPLSFWVRIRQEIRAAIQQYHQDLAEEQAQGGNNNNTPSRSFSSSSSSSSCVEIPPPSAQTRSPSAAHSVVLLSLSSSSSSASLPGSSQHSQLEDMVEDSVNFSAPPGSSSQSKGKDRKRDRDEEEHDDSSSAASGSEKRLKSSPASPAAEEGEDNDEDDDGIDSQKSSSRNVYSGSGSGSESGSGSSDSSYRPGSGSSTSSGSGSGSGSGSSLGSGGSSSGGSYSGSGSRHASGSGSGSSFEPPAESSNVPGSSTLQLCAAPSSGVAAGSGPTPTFLPLHGEAEVPVMEPHGDEPDQEDTTMIMSEVEAHQAGNNFSDSDHDDGDEEDSDDDEQDGTQPFRFTDHQLQDFVAKRKGLLVRDSQAVTITLKSNKDARWFYRFLNSQDYSGRWLNIKLTWNWNRDELGLLVQALTNSPIEVLFLDGCCDHAIAPSAATVPDTRYSRLTLPLAALERAHQAMDNKTKTLRYDPLIRLFRNSQFRELHFYGLPNLFQQSSAPLPWALSQFRTFRLHAQIDNWGPDGFQANRFIGFVQRAINLEHLYLDCPTDQYYIYMDKIEWALNQSRRNKDSPPLDIHFQHRQHRQTLLRVKYDQWDRELKEFEVDLMGTCSESYIAWKQVLEHKADGTLGSLAFKNMPDEKWMGTMMNWVVRHTNNRGLGLRHLQLDCLHFGPAQFHDLVELLELTQPRLQTLDLRNVYISFPRSGSSSSASQSPTMIDRDLGWGLNNDAAASVQMITWPTLIKALNISVLMSLRIMTSNLQDRDIDRVVDCLRTMASSCKKLAMEKLLFQDTQLSVHGERTLVKEVQVFLSGVDVKFR
ncbi:hypothetical protein BGW39_003677 [Mortierella sp. 14UC]|nr:hypothetical protein BGW39_003677 [Mortierella sp. 14UC]